VATPGRGSRDGDATSLPRRSLNRDLSAVSVQRRPPRAMAGKAAAKKATVLVKLVSTLGTGKRAAPVPPPMTHRYGRWTLLPSVRPVSPAHPYRLFLRSS